YREFHLDLNESGSAPLITLDSLQLFSSSSATLTGYNGIGFNSGSSTLLYDLDGDHGTDTSVLLTDWNSGGGHGDYKVDIPDSYFPTSGNPYIYLYSAFSQSDSGFEEWYVTKAAAPVIAIQKAVADVNGHPNNLVVHQAGDVIDYTITVTNPGNVPLSS